MPHALLSFFLLALKQLLLRANDFVRSCVAALEGFCGALNCYRLSHVCFCSFRCLHLRCSVGHSALLTGGKDSFSADRPVSLSSPAFCNTPNVLIAELGAFLSWESKAFSARLLPMVLKELGRVCVETLPHAAVRPSHMTTPVYL